MITNVSFIHVYLLDIWLLVFWHDPCILTIFIYRLLLVYLNTNHISQPKNRDKGKLEGDTEKLKMVIRESRAHGWAPTTLRITGA
jgi:hypothetical protein